jgi:hypothetical protein
MLKFNSQKRELEDLGILTTSSTWCTSYQANSNLTTHPIQHRPKVFEPFTKEPKQVR